MKWQFPYISRPFFLWGMKSYSHEKISEASANFIKLTMQSLSMAQNFPLSPHVSTYGLFDLTQTPPHSSSQVAEDVADSLRCMAGGFGTATSTTCWWIETSTAGRCRSFPSCHPALLAKELTFCFLRKPKENRL